jgi:hypothetical protein
VKQGARPLASLLGALLLLLAGCQAAAPGAGGGRSTADPRVRSFMGQVPPELAGGARLNAAAPPSLAALRGRVVYVQFAFPT